MAFTHEQVAALKAPLNRAHVRQRSQAGRSLSYIEGWKAIEEANRIFGFDAWDRETIDLRELGEPRQVGDKWRVAYMARVRMRVRTGDNHIVRDGCGYGSGIDRDLGSAHESALKEAETDAMKRALMTFGYPFGLALYDKDQAHVADAEPARPAGNGSEPAAAQNRAAEAVGRETPPPLAELAQSANPSQARKNGDWARILADLSTHAEDTRHLVAWARSRSMRLDGHPWGKEAREAWRGFLDTALAKECQSVPQLNMWREEMHEHTKVLPTDWQLVASGALEDAKNNLTATEVLG